MFTVKALSLALLLGGSALAAPAKREDVVQNVVVKTAVVATVTSYVAPGAIQTPAPAPAVFNAAPKVDVVSAPSPAPSNPFSSIVSSVTGGSDSSDEPSYVSLINKYRSDMGLGALSFSQALQDGIQQTVDNGDGQMVHHFYDDATGQVLAPASNWFEAMVQAWLCEIPSLPGLGDACDSGLYNAGGDTGHADILKNPSATQIGCADSQGIYGCDLA